MDNSSVGPTKSNPSQMEAKRRDKQDYLLVLRRMNEVNAPVHQFVGYASIFSDGSIIRAVWNDGLGPPAFESFPHPSPSTEYDSKNTSI